MSKEAEAQDSADDITVTSPFVGGDPIEDENLGTMTDLVENATEDAGRFQAIESAEARQTKLEQAKHEEAPSLGDAKEDDEKEDDETDASAETAEAEETAAETTDEAETPEDLDDAGEPTDKAEAEEGEEADKKAPIRIPKYRLDQEVAKRRAAEDRAKRLEEQLKTAQPYTEAPDLKFDIAGDVKAAFEKVLDGDMDSATQAIVDVITNTNKQVLEAARADTAKQVVAGTNKQSAASELDQVIDQLESTYDVFNQQSENFNSDLVDEVLAMQAGYAATGMTPAQAMQKAADNALLLYGYAVAEGDEPAAQTEAKEPPKPSRQVEKNVKAKEQQPPPLPPSSSDDQGDAASDYDITQMTIDEFEALPESVQRRLRGDYVS